MLGSAICDLGNSATTLSGGEAQRVKLAAHLAHRACEGTLFLFDEPTTGSLHFDDIAKLLASFERLINNGASVLVIEHNIDMVQAADWIIDLGPGRGSGREDSWHKGRRKRSRQSRIVYRPVSEASADAAGNCVMASFRELPSVDQVLRSLKITDVPQEVVSDEIRAELAERREALKRGTAARETSVEAAVRERIAALLRPSLRPVINATGVVLHTNLGRAPFLPRFEPLPTGYSNLEYDLKTGKRGKRDVHTGAPFWNVVLIKRPAIPD